MELQAIVKVNTSQKENHNSKSFENIFLEKTGKDFNKFYKQYYSKLVWKIKSMNINSIDAEDIANRAFIQSLEKIEQYNPLYNFSTWLFDIGKKMAYQFIKDSAKTICIDINSNEDSETYSPIVNIFNNLSDDHTDVVEVQTKTNIKYKETLKEISYLDDKYRTIIELSDIQGKTYNQICEILDIDLQTVKNRLFHGRLKIEKNLKNKLHYINNNY